MSRTYHRERGASSFYSSDTLVGSDDGLGTLLVAITVRDLGRAHRASSVTRTSRSDTKKTRGEQAAEMYEGFSSSETEDEDEAHPMKYIPADNIDRHMAAMNNAGHRKLLLALRNSTTSAQPQSTRSCECNNMRPSTQLSKWSVLEPYRSSFPNRENT